MNEPTLEIRELARRLVVLESSRGAGPAGGDGEVARVCEKLRAPLTRLAGTAGYTCLTERAVAMARAKISSLNLVQVRSDGGLDGFDEIVQQDPEAGVAVLVNLLSLLVTFIGEPLTLGLVRNAWPDAPLEAIDLRVEDQQ
jgi:hypothetical protein